jgi:YihY family inner membrane protein
MQVRAGEAATSIAFFALFSLFPLLIFIIAGASLFLEPGAVRGQIFFYIRTILPISQGFILETVDTVLFERPAIGPLALISLLWSASGVFSSLALHINRAWSDLPALSFIHSRVVALVMVAMLMALLFLSLLTTTVLALLAQVRFPLGGSTEFYGTILFFLVAAALPFLIRLGLLYGLYRWVPTARVRGRAAFWGALTAAMLWEIITRGFAWYLSSGFNRYEQTYGTLATLVALMFYIYLGSQSVLFGAHIAAAVDGPERVKKFRHVSS